MADKRIDELEEATSITANDLFVLEQANTAKKLSGQTMTTFLTALANGHGGISSIQKTSSTGTNPVIDTYTITYADASTSTFTVTNGKKGDTGAQGVQGPKGDDITITSATVEYISGISGTTVPTGTWQSTVPTVPQGGYLWTRIITNYSDGTGVTSYSVSRMGIDGSGAVSTVNNVSPDGNGNVSLTASDIGALPDSYTAPVTSVNTKTGTVALTATDVGAVASVCSQAPDNNGNVALAASNVGAVPVSGSDGFLYRSSNAVSQKELYKSLWTGTWSSGDTTVSGLSNYHVFLIKTAAKSNHADLADHIIATTGAEGDGYKLTGIGGHARSATEYNIFSIQATQSGDTLTFAFCHARVSSSSITALEVTEIIGII